MKLTCRFCHARLEHVFADLRTAPLANSYLEEQQLNRMEPHFPLVVYVCHQCLLVQLELFATPDEIFSKYSYFSSFSDSWLEHANRYARAMIERWSLGAESKVVEIASNDGYLLQYFKAEGIPVLGVDPAVNVAEAARAKGIPTETMFFGEQAARSLAAKGHLADLMAANNVLAHVPDISGFVAGFKVLLKRTGVATLEFPHFLNLIEQCQFDTIYHEHFSYLTLSVVERIFGHHGLRIFDVEEVPTHGGSLRVYACHSEDSSKSTAASVPALKQREAQHGLDRLSTYQGFQREIERIKADTLKFLIGRWESNKKVVGYGAPAKGNTLLNFLGVGREFLQYTVDRNPEKSGHYLPGSRIPIYPPSRLRETKPDYVFILPWNLKDEIVQQVGFIREWGGKFVTAIPRLEVF